jgi:hypothetical protein
VRRVVTGETDRRLAVGVVLREHAVEMSADTMAPQLAGERGGASWERGIASGSAEELLAAELEQGGKGLRHDQEKERGIATAVGPQGAP